MENNELNKEEAIMDAKDDSSKDVAKEDIATDKKEEKVEKKEEPKKEKKVLNFFITTLNGMAYGLFATLIIGTIIGTIGTFFKDGNNDFCHFMYDTLTFTGNKCLAFMTGAGIGVGVAIALKFNPLQTIVLAAVGELTACLSLSTKFVTNGVINNGTFQIGDPLTIYLVVILAALAMKFILRKKTPVDILIVPLLGVTIALVLGLLIRFPAIYVTYGIQFVVDKSTSAVPFVMGIVIAVLMGMALTAPISSAAIGAMVFVASETSGEGLYIASGAAIVGCCCQMVGFAIQSRRDNNIGMVISIGIGTSMLQFKNIIRKPQVWLPTIIASAILGPIVTCAFNIYCVGSAAGMGTSGLVGQIGTLASMGYGWQAWVGIVAFEIVLPGGLVFLFDYLFYKIGLIKKDYLTV